MDLPRRASVAAALAFALGACAAQPGTVEATDDEISSVPLTEIERESIGLSWMYAYASWVESLHGSGLDASPSYWAYWHWFDQIALGHGATIATGGNWTTANALAAKWGVGSERAFLAGGNPDASAREQAALAAIDESLASGVLSSPIARRDRLAVRRELDRAWGLAPDVSAALDRVFGEDVSRTLLPTSEPADTSGTPILRADEVTVAYAAGPGAPRVQRRLTDAMREWRATYFSSATDPATYYARIEAAVRDGQPAILTWFVDFGALESRDNGRLGAFNLRTLNELGPGTQGGHSGVIETTARDATGQLRAFGVRNAWGAARPERASLPGMPDRHELWLDYLGGPVKRCIARANTTDTTNCPYQQIPLQDVVLPPGY